MDFIDTFSGLGGATLGASKSGLNPILGIDLARIAARTYEDMTGVRSSIMDLSNPLETLKRAGISQSFKGVLWGSPPCQGMSPSGQQFDRQPLVDFVVSSSTCLLESFPLAWVVIENAKELAIGPKFAYARLAIINSAIKSGRVPPPWYSSVRDSSTLGIPQKRTRTIIAFPPKGAKPIEVLLPVPKTVTLRSIMGIKDLMPTSVPLSPLEKEIYKDIPPGGNWTSRPLRKMSKEALAFLEHTDGGPGFLKRLSWDDQSPTIMASIRARLKSGTFLHPGPKLRRFTMGEQLLIQGLPMLQFPPGISLKDSQRLIGNAVPPVMAALVLSAIARKYA